MRRFQEVNMRVAFFLAFALGMIGCADRSGTSPMTTSLVDSSYILSDIQLQQISVDGSQPYTKAVGYLQIVDSTKPVYGGVLSINGVSIPARHFGAGTTYVGRGDSGTAPLMLDGSWQIFAVSGSGTFPPLLDSLRSPLGATAITAPRSRDTVSKSTGFTVMWNATGPGGAHLMIADTSTEIGHRLLDTIMPSDPGSIVLTPSMLSGLVAGPINLMVTRGDIKYGAAGQHVRYRLAIGSTRQISLLLTP
jgi:hypothetical protein